MSEIHRGCWNHKSKSHHRSPALLAAAAGLSLACTVADAQDIFWNGATANWNLAANWTPANIPNAAVENAMITAGGSYLVSVDSSFSIGTLTMSNPTGMVQINNGQFLATNGNVANSSTLTINSTAGSSATYWQVLANLSLSGSGTIVLNANTANLTTAYLTYGSAGNILTHGAGHTIRGTGRVFTNVINDGVIQADIAGKVLDLLTTAKTNNNLMRAINGAFLDISVPVTQSLAGQIVGDGGTVRLSSASVTNGTITAQNGGLIDFTGTTALNSLALNGPSQIQNGQVVQIGDAGGIVHNGTMTINATAGTSATYLQAMTTTSLSGTGTIVLNANAANPSTAYLTYGSAGNILTHGASHTIRGTGRIFTNVVNDGVIQADSTGNILDLLTTAKTNNNLMRAINGAFLDISVPVTQSLAGQIVGDGGTVRLGSASVTNGTMTAQNGGLINFTGTTTLNSLALNGPSQIQNGQVVQIGDAAGIVHNGTMTINPTAGTSATYLQALTTTFLSGTGTIVLNANAANPTTAYLTYASATNILTHGASHTIRGTGRIFTNVFNDGVIQADSAGNVLNLITTAKTNNNLMRAINGGILEITVPITQSVSGQIIADAGRVRLGSASVTNGALTAQGIGGLIEVFGTTDLNSLTLSGPLEVNNGVQLQTTAGFINNGIITINPTAGGSATILQVLTNLTIGGAGTIRLNANPANLNTSYLTYSSAANVLTLGPGQNLVGRGRVYTRINNQGRIAPGNGVGDIGQIDTIQNITHLSGGLMDMEIGGTAVTAFDRITGGGTIVLSGGTLRVTTVNAFNPTPGQTFAIISGPAITGTFCETILPIGWGVTYTSNSVIMEYTGCVGDTDNGSGCGVPDAGVTFDDLLFYLTIFDAGDIRADVDDGSFTGTRDGGITIDDLLYYLFRFDAGC